MEEAKRTDVRLIVFSFMVCTGLAVVLFFVRSAFPDALQKHGAVSYTHRDVYKRQRLYLFVTENATESFGRLLAVFSLITRHLGVRE